MSRRGGGGGGGGGAGGGGRFLSASSASCTTLQAKSYTAQKLHRSSLSKHRTHPPLAFTLGWYTGVMNLTFGGLKG